MNKQLANLNAVFQVKRLNEQNGQHFFSPDAMRSFRCRVHDSLYGGCVFVTSEQERPSRFNWNPVRVYTVRVAMADGSIQTYGSMGDYATRADAHTDARWLGKQLKSGSMVYCSQTYDFVESQEMLALVSPLQS